MGRGISKDAVFQKLWTIACYDNDSYVKEDWKALERIVWDGIKAQEGLITVRHQCDQYDARRRESIAKFEKLRKDYQKLRKGLRAFITDYLGFTVSHKHIFIPLIDKLEKLLKGEK